MQLDAQGVKRILPHRSPMLMVDTAEDLIPLEKVKTSLFIDPTWDVFRGHFPGDPVFPGVLTVEAMAQASDLIVMTAERYAHLTPLFAGIQNVRFRRKVLPGDTLTCIAETAKIDEERAILVCQAQAFVGEELAAEAEIRIAMR